MIRSLNNTHLPTYQVPLGESLDTRLEIMETVRDVVKNSGLHPVLERISNDKVVIAPSTTIIAYPFPEPLTSPEGWHLECETRSRDLRPKREAGMGKVLLMIISEWCSWGCFFFPAQ